MENHAAVHPPADPPAAARRGAGRRRGGRAGMVAHGNDRLPRGMGRGGLTNRPLQCGEEDHMAYSSFTLAEVISKFGLTADTAGDLFGHVPPVALNPGVRQAL